MPLRPYPCLWWRFMNKIQNNLQFSNSSCSLIHYWLWFPLILNSSITMCLVSWSLIIEICSPGASSCCLLYCVMTLEDLECNTANILVPDHTADIHANARCAGTCAHCLFVHVCMNNEGVATSSRWDQYSAVCIWATWTLRLLAWAAHLEGCGSLQWRTARCGSEVQSPGLEGPWCLYCPGNTVCQYHEPYW